MPARDPAPGSSLSPSLVVRRFRASYRLADVPGKVGFGENVASEPTGAVHFPETPFLNLNATPTPFKRYACIVIFPGSAANRRDLSAMSESNCPICYGPLEVREVAPCWSCGADPVELVHLAERRHEYAEVRVLGVNIVLCSVCRLDFWSYDSTHFARGPEFRLGKDMVFVRDVLSPKPGKDKYCAHCRGRLAFLRFLAAVRECRPE
jgi:hypothetical protein